jgi:hypothetical protein
MPKPYIKVLLDFVRTSPASRLTRANAVYTGMNANPKYPNPPFNLMDLKAKADAYTNAIGAAMDGGKMATAVRDDLGDTIVDMLRKLAHYVQAACEGDMEALLSSGFLPAPSARTQTPAVTQFIRYIRPGPNTGTMLLSLLAQKDAFSYEIGWCIPNADGTPGTWSTQPAATVRPASVVKDLIPGTAYMFRVRTVTKAGHTDWSQPIIRIVT